MATINTTKKSRLYDFQSGSPARSAEVDAEFNQLITELNHIVDDLTALNSDTSTHIASATAHNASKLVNDSSAIGTTIKDALNNIVSGLESHIETYSNNKHRSNEIALDASLTFKDDGLQTEISTVTEALNRLKEFIETHKKTTSAHVASKISNDSEVTGSTVGAVLNTINYNLTNTSNTVYTHVEKTGTPRHDSDEITNMSGVSGTQLTNALNTLNAAIAALVVRLDTLNTSQIENDGDYAVGQTASEALDLLERKYRSQADRISLVLAENVAETAEVVDARVSPMYGTFGLLKDRLDATEMGDLGLFNTLNSDIKALKSEVRGIHDENIFDCFSYADWNDLSGATITQITSGEMVKNSQSLRLSTATAGSQGRMRRVYPQIDLTTMTNCGYWFYIPDITKVAWISFAWASGASYNDRVELKYYGPNYSDGTKISLEEGWNYIKIPKEFYETKDAGVTNWNAALNHYIIVMPTTGNNCDVYFSHITMNEFKNNYVCLSFDDGYASVYNTIHPWLVENNIPANMWLTKDYITGVKSTGFTHLTIEQLNTMYNTGIWEFMNHSTHHTDNLNTKTQEVQEEEYFGCRDWMIANGWSRKNSALSFATPGAGKCWDTQMITNFKEFGCLLMRTNRNFIANALPIANMHSIASYSTGPTTTLSDFVSYSKLAAKNGSLIVVYAHNVVTGTPAALQTQMSLLKNIIANLKAQGFTFIKFMDWYETTLTQ